MLNGLTSGDRVVVSGQFLIDSEASLTGVMERLSGPSPGASQGLHESEGVVVRISAQEIELDHEPFRTLNMPTMQMTFPLSRPELANGIEPHQRVRVGVRQTAQGFVVERIELIEAKP